MRNERDLVKLREPLSPAALARLDAVKARAVSCHERKRQAAAAKAAAKATAWSGETGDGLHSARAASSTAMATAAGVGMGAASPMSFSGDAIGMVRGIILLCTASRTDRIGSD